MTLRLLNIPLVFLTQSRRGAERQSISLSAMYFCTIPRSTQMN